MYVDLRGILKYDLDGSRVSLRVVVQDFGRRNMRNVFMGDYGFLFYWNL